MMSAPPLAASGLPRRLHQKASRRLFQVVPSEATNLSPSRGRCHRLQLFREPQALVEDVGHVAIFPLDGAFGGDPPVADARSGHAGGRQNVGRLIAFKADPPEIVVLGTSLGYGPARLGRMLPDVVMGDPLVADRHAGLVDGRAGLALLLVTLALGGVVQSAVRLEAEPAQRRHGEAEGGVIGSDPDVAAEMATLRCAPDDAPVAGQAVEPGDLVGFRGPRSGGLWMNGVAAQHRVDRQRRAVRFVECVTDRDLARCRPVVLVRHPLAPW